MIKQVEYISTAVLRIIINNAKRLQKLADKILDVTKIEANLLKLNRSRYDINEIVIKVSTEYRHIIDMEICKEDLKNNNLI